MRIKLECDRIISYKDVTYSEMKDYDAMRKTVEELLDDWYEKRSVKLFEILEQ